MGTEWNRRAVMAAGVALAGCSTLEPPRGRETITPLKLSASRLMRITSCLRPFRATGPRMEAEDIGPKRIVHNYGHGGSGWSLAWGSATEAMPLVMARQPERIAVVGAGAIGLTTALELARTGTPVTIYAKEFPAESRSARATGTWSPDSRIAMKDQMGADFPARWERLARLSYLQHQHYVGRATHDVEFTPRYRLSDGEDGAEREVMGFAHFEDAMRDVVPGGVTIPPERSPFPVARTRKVMTMTFNVTQYSQTLLDEFFALGGRIERVSFSSPEEVLTLPEPVIVNCTGYGARALFGDESLTPVRGQVGWLAAQPEALYGVYYNGGTALSRRDGIIIQNWGQTDEKGWNDADETPREDEFLEALNGVAGAFEGWA